MEGLEAALGPERVAELREAFQLFDLSGSGSISLEELREVLQKLGQDVAEAQALLAAGDINGDGTVSWREFLQLMHSLDPSDPYSDLRSAFKVYDVNGDGFISPPELKQVMSSVNCVDLSDEKVAQLIDGADTNKDGKIDFEEFVAMLSSKEAAT